MQPELERMKQIDALTEEAAAVADAHESLSRQLAQYATPESTTIAAINANPRWAELIQPYAGLGDEVVAGNLALKSHLAMVAESSYLAQERILQVLPNVFGVAAGFNEADMFRLNDASSVLMQDYRTLIKSFEESQLVVASLPPIVSSGPSVELLTTAKLLGSLSVPADAEHVEDRGSHEEQELAAEIEASLEGLLVDLDAELGTVWRGAHQAFTSDNPDRIRHIIVSLRELVGHVLRRIAPDEDVRAWTNDPAYFHDGHPTRAARMRFVCRTIDHGPFSKFVEADVKAGIECIALFQRGTHELNINFSEHQVRTLLLRTASLLRFLLVTWQAGRRE